MSDSEAIDPRTQALLSLLPPSAVFRHTYAEDALWCPNNRGYVNERDPLRAGLYQPDGHYDPWAPPSNVECSACDGTGEREDVNGEQPERCDDCGGLGYVHNPGGRPNDHSFTIDAAEYLRKYTVQDGTTLALLIDEVLQLRARVKLHEEQLAAPNEQRGVGSSMRDVGRVVIGGRINDDAEEYLSARLHTAGVWHITWVDDTEIAAMRASQLGAVLLTVTAADVVGEFVTHVREDGRRVALAEWCASINPGRHASDCEDDHD